MSATQERGSTLPRVDRGLSGIEIRRTRQWFATARRLSVHIDGTEAGAVGFGSTTRLGVSPGRHTVRVSIDWVRTPDLAVELDPGEVVVLEVGLRQRGWRWLISGLASIFRPHKVLYLQRIDP